MQGKFGVRGWALGAFVLRPFAFSGGEEAGPVACARVAGRARLVPVRTSLDLLRRPGGLDANSVGALSRVTRFGPHFFIHHHVFGASSVRFGVCYVRPKRSGPLRGRSNDSRVLCFIRNDNSIVINSRVTTVRTKTYIRIPRSINRRVVGANARQVVIILTRSPLPYLRRGMPGPPTRFGQITTTGFRPTTRWSLSL